MGGAALRQQFESVLGGPLEWQARPAPEMVRTGVPEVDAATGGLPRGCLTEIFGAGFFRPHQPAGFRFWPKLRRAKRSARWWMPRTPSTPLPPPPPGCGSKRLLWVRCGHNAEHALKAADLLIQGGGFGLVVMDLGDTPPATARRISLTSWFRLRRAVEHTPTVLLAVARQSNARTCASLMLECRPDAGVRVVPFGARARAAAARHPRAGDAEKPGQAVRLHFMYEVVKDSCGEAPVPQGWKSVDREAGHTLRLSSRERE